MAENIDIKRIAKFALFGAVGFGVGGAIMGWAFKYPGIPLSPVIMGALGGAALGLALKRRVIALSVLGAVGAIIGIIIGGVIAFLDVLFLEVEIEELLPNVLLSIILGAFLGAALGLALKGGMKIAGLALAGVLGGAIGVGIVSAITNDLSLQIFLQGIIGGTFLGAAVGFLEKGGKCQESTPISELITPESIKGEGETFDYSTNKCPYCNSPTIEGGIIYQAENDKERKTIGYSTKWQKVCLKCKSKWIAVEK